MKRFELGDFKPVLAGTAAAEIDVVLVGGQAVNFYAEHYLGQHSGLVQFAPFVSKDADLLGNLDDGMRLARVMGGQWERNPRKGGMQGLSLGKVVLQPGTGEVEILGRILGATQEEVRHTAMVVQQPETGRFKIIHPLLLYIVKGNNTVQLPQREAGRERQDGRQFAIMSLVISVLIKEFTRDSSAQNARFLFKTCGRLLDFWRSEDGAVLVAAGVVDPAGLLPVGIMSSHPETSVRNFVEKRLPVFFDQQLPSAVKRVPPRLIEKVRADFQGILDLLHSAFDTGS